ncbi:DUF1217 domain-containing protein [Methylocapsa polymorpha]|uniref:DUF1217 domain-containing protein n=1 Tax=Methylocapsa polymorpha TaxID=3080828 RepID=A0ABZ0HVZ8_9HYPH|nr:DUF1217 domain-containing protein [Methylocapsa sp. RX1]
MLTATLYYNSIIKNYPKTLASTASEPTVVQATKYYLANIGNVKSVNDLLNNDKLYTYVMTAFGLRDMMNAKGLIRQVLEGGVSSSKSLANTLNDPRYKALATAFNFAANGAAATQATSAQQGAVNNYVEQTLESDVGKQNQGVQMALYFQRMAPSITSAYSILADKQLLSVVQTALGLSPLMSTEPIDTQAALISKQFKISDLQNPAKLQKFIERFTATYDAQNGSTQPTSPTLSLFTGNSPGISSNLLLQLANLKLGGS